MIRYRCRELDEMARACRRVPEHPARTFREAVQCQWLVQVVSRLEQSIGGGVSNGRMDQYLCPFFERDKRAGILDDESALALLESIWLGIACSTELYALPGQVSFTDGLAHWEAVTIGGQTPDGQDATNQLSHLILRSKREFPLGYPDLAARIHSRTPNRFLHDVCETIKQGAGFPKLFFDEEIVPLLVSKGGAVDEANDYCIVGCTEVKMLNRDTAATGCALVNLGTAARLRSDRPVEYWRLSRSKNSWWPSPRRRGRPAGNCFPRAAISFPSADGSRNSPTAYCNRKVLESSTVAWWSTCG